MKELGIDTSVLKMSENYDFACPALNESLRKITISLPQLIV
jgi:hypothetical protein